MFKKSTGELEKQLEHTHPEEISEYINENSDDLLSGSREFMEFMNERIKEKGISKQDVFIKADIPQGYGYKLLTEEKVTKQRDVILRLCYAAELTVAETQQALKIYHMDTLYARDPRDALLMVCFNERPGNIIAINSLLIKNKMSPLRSSGVQD